MKKVIIILAIIELTLFVNLNVLTAQEGEKFLYTLPKVNQVTIQKNTEYRKKNGESLKFDFYRLPINEKSDSLPIVIFMNGFGSADIKDSPLQVEWAKVCAASGLAAVTFQSKYDGQSGKPDLLIQQISEDFDLLVAHLKANQKQFGIDPNKIIVHASSGNVVTGLPIVMDKNRSFIKGAVIYYGNGEVKEFRSDLPVFFVRSGLDQPNLIRQIDVLLGRALAANMPFEIVNHPGGQHPFEIGENNEISREIIERTINFMHKSVSEKVQNSIQATMDEAKAGAFLLNENWSEAVKGYAKMVAKRPQDNEMHRRYADALFGAKEYSKAVEEYEQALNLGSWRKRDIAYPASVASAKLGDLELTLKWLNRLVNTPFDRTKLLTDSNFESLKNEPKFLELIENKKN